MMMLCSLDNLMLTTRGPIDVASSTVGRATRSGESVV